ncbi:phosphonate ABC transporter ATP-binding protein [Paenibacillus alkalitolerans]|uniref:phosphonate ABC transporter ATP-binding protein n=1 Tax=Paenibacillus alkalitolerans TaxID=2799335 RepID=UPI0018F50D2A|nr:ATP-binding cassette domain-containing protein [Paenibacillus alkalitolerans]
MLTVRKLVKKYGDAVVLNGIDLHVESGQFVAIVGGSGSGKSTLVRCLGLKEQWDEGNLLYKGVNYEMNQSWFTRWKLSKDWAFIDSSPQLNGKQTAFRNVISGRFRQFSFWRLLLGGKPSEDEYTRAMDFLQKVGLLDQAFQKIDTMSGGEKQRVAIARALGRGARIIIADDPVSNLDPHSAERVLEDLKQLCKHENILVICVFQNIEMAEKYSSRIIGLDNGKIALDVSGRRLTSAEKHKIQ